MAGQNHSLCSLNAVAISAVLLAAALLFGGCGSASQGGGGTTTDGSPTAVGAVSSTADIEKIGGTWEIGAVYIDGALIDIHDNPSIEDMYDLTKLTFKEDGTFVFLDTISSRGTWEKKAGADSDTYVLTSESKFMYGLVDGEISEKDMGSENLSDYIAELIDGDTLLVSFYDAAKDAAKEESSRRLFVREGSESSYIASNKKDISEASRQTTTGDGADQGGENARASGSTDNASTDSAPDVSSMMGTWRAESVYVDGETYDAETVAASGLEMPTIELKSSGNTYVVDSDDLHIEGTWKAAKTDDGTPVCAFTRGEGVFGLLSTGNEKALLVLTTEDDEDISFVMVRNGASGNGSSSASSGNSSGSSGYASGRGDVGTATSGERNALDRAKSYLNYTSFSRKGLIDQLKFEGYSSSEAEYAVDNCGADWYKQAELKAADYLAYASFSRQGLVEQLEFEGFTHDQAEHGADVAY